MHVWFGWPPKKGERMDRGKFLKQVSLLFAGIIVTLPVFNQDMDNLAL